MMQMVDFCTVRMAGLIVVRDGLHVVADGPYGELDGIQAVAYRCPTFQ
jgi:hypothetical protein